MSKCIIFVTNYNPSFIVVMMVNFNADTTNSYL